MTEKTMEKSDVNSTEPTGENILNDQMSDAILMERPNVSWDNVAGLDSAKKTLIEGVVLPLKYPDLFSGRKGRPWQGILLYGPPGTGKSDLTKALATETTNTSFFYVSSRKISSKWSDGEKLLQTLFTTAREHKNSIIFIDEVDALCGDCSEYESLRRVKTEFLIQMGGENKNVQVLGATNTPWMLDATTRKRFEKRICIPLPEASVRSEIFKIHLRNAVHSLAEEDFTELGKRTNGFSGYDIPVVVKEALMVPVRKLQTATHFRKVEEVCNKDPLVSDTMNHLLIPCSSEAQGAIKMSWVDVPKDRLFETNVSMGDMLESLVNYKPTVTEDDLRKLEEFTRDFVAPV
ncbi:vacuolar protein sorting-associated protein 4B-like [Mytilus edulis]|uniref:vacuolar protein sorting-associated protein 4B-like n=1 Tax=Mytilus edulis TaxID=6550 RepID=UPI0039EF43F6